MSEVTEERFHIRTRPAETAVVVELAGELDLLAAPVLASRFESLREGGWSCVVVDALRLDFIDAAGIRCLLEAADLLGREGSSFHVVPSRTLTTVLRLLDMEGLFLMFESVDDAIAAISGESGT